jgi:hypothetical protein
VLPEEVTVGRTESMQTCKGYKPVIDVIATAGSSYSKGIVRYRKYREWWLF